MRRPAAATFLAAAALIISLASCEDDDADQGLAQSSSVTEPATTPTAPTTAPAPMDPPAQPIEMPPATVAPVGVAPVAGDPVDFQDLAAELGKAFCERVFSCCGPSEAMTLVLGPSLTRENCPALAPFYFGDYFKRYTLSMVEQRVSYFPDRVDACLDRLTSRTCEQFGASLYPAVNPYYPYSSYPYYSGTLPPSAFSCDELFAPSQLPGELCQNDYECADGFCVATIGSDRRCQALSHVGQGCQPYTPSRCAAGLYCASGACRQIGKEGDTCYDTYSAYACEPGLYCAAGVYPAAATCRPKLADGSSCSYGTVSCKSGRCDYSGTTPGYVCMPALQPPASPPQACIGPN
jgi:hypothetical protein